MATLSLQFIKMIWDFHHRRGTLHSSRFSRRLEVLVAMWKNIMWIQPTIKLILRMYLPMSRLQSYHPMFRLPNQFLRRFELQASLWTYMIWTQIWKRVMGCWITKPKVLLPFLFHPLSTHLLLRHYFSTTISYSHFSNITSIHYITNFSKHPVTTHYFVISFSIHWRP